MRLYFFSFCLLSCICIVGCNDEVAISPKPRAYPKIEFPERGYQNFDENYCQFTFEYPNYATVEQDTLFFDERPVDPCWFDIYVKQFDARIHFSYYPIGRDKTFEDLNFDAFKLSNKHVSKAEYIDPKPFRTKKGVSGFTFKLDGPVATPYQFFLTDSTKHFLRGALYFNTQSRPDSLAPLIDFFEEDIDHLIQSFEWSE